MGGGKIASYFGSVVTTCIWKLLTGGTNLEPILQIGAIFSASKRRVLSPDIVKLSGYDRVSRNIFYDHFGSEPCCRIETVLQLRSFDFVHCSVFN